MAIVYQSIDSAKSGLHRVSRSTGTGPSRQGKYRQPKSLEYLVVSWTLGLSGDDGWSDNILNAFMVSEVVRSRANIAEDPKSNIT